MVLTKRTRSPRSGYRRRSPRSGYRSQLPAVAVTAIVVAATGALSGCITVPNEAAQPTAAHSATGPVSYLDRLKATPVAPRTDQAGSVELPQFVTDDRNIACVFTSSRAGNLNQPWEPNNFPDSANAAAAIVPVVNCELANYPGVSAADQLSNCSGTNIGYLGGTALLTPETASYGGCRAGVTAVEAAFGPQGSVNEVMARIPVLIPGQAMEADGYRCAPMDDGVTCANLSASIGFFISATGYEILNVR